MKSSKPEESSLLEKIQQLNTELVTTQIESENYASELFKSEERFSLAMIGANDGLWDWNLETDEVYYSPRWKSMLGYHENELDPTLATWAKLVHADDKPSVLEQVQNYVSGHADSFEVEMRMHHQDGGLIHVLSRAVLVTRESDNKALRLVGTHVDITERKKSAEFNKRHAEILEMIAIGRGASDIYNAIALMYEERHPGLRCSLLELHGNKLLHGGAPSLPKEYAEAIHGLEYGPNVGSCGSSTYTGKRVIVENINTDPKWQKIKHIALPHGMQCCWSEPIKDSSGKVLGAFGMYYDHPALPDEEDSKDLTSAASLASIVMERDQSQKRIRTLAYSDELTELPNRAALYQRLGEMIDLSSQNNVRFGLLYLDLDNFKSVNDSLGHDAGDQLLKAVATRLKSICRETDFVARLSGDEFCIIAEEDGNSTTNLAQRCLQVIGQPLEILARHLTPASSIGIAHYPDDGQDIPSLLKAADTSLYAAKDSGKNQYTLYKPELSLKAEYQFQIEHDLREAINQQQLTLAYQPQINIDTGKIIGVEALSRWHHPSLGQVSPLDFIAIAERIGMIKTLTEWVLMTACHQFKTWKKQGLDHQHIAVNISPSHFLDKAFVPLIIRTLEKTGISPTELTLEVTESVAQTDQRNLSTFKDLKSLGVQLAIDDFGTGYSSFASLKHLNVDCLKIDKYFIDDIISDKKTRILISTMIEMGRNLGYEITAEGVETSEQLDILKKLGCQNVQGYLFSKPVTADEISALLHHQYIRPKVILANKIRRNEF
jgi:diguanylate cyclase (GGDEF)-like protein/PAS domain S-box-containing protein